MEDRKDEQDEDRLVDLTSSFVVYCGPLSNATPIEGKYSGGDEDVG